MSNLEKPQAVIFRDLGHEHPLWASLERVLKGMSNCTIFDTGTIKNADDFQTLLTTLPPECSLWIDLAWAEMSGISYLESWRSQHIILVKGEGASLAGDSSWRHCSSSLNLSTLPALDLPRVVQVCLAHERFPGIVSLNERGSEVFFDKVQGLQEIGQKIDRLLGVIEQKYPVLLPQFFNLRQLMFAILHQAFESGSSIGSIANTVDFQVSASEKRLVFGVRFAAAPGSLEEWLNEMQTGSSHLWHNARISADLLILTELTAVKQIEVKAMVSPSGAFQAAEENSLFSRVIPSFDPERFAKDQLRAAKLLPLSGLGDSKSGKSSAPMAAAPSEASTAGEASQLNFRLKSDILERERNNLHGMVKKKTHLIASLNKDVNRAQKELILVQNNTSKELHKMRMETEKAKNEAKQAEDKLSHFMRKAAEKQAEEGGGTTVAGQPKRDFEKEWKQADYAKRVTEEKVAELSHKLTHQEEIIQKTRKELSQFATENNELKAKLFKLEQTAVLRSKDDKGSQVSNAEAMLAAKLKESQKLLGESRMKEQELAKDIKRLTIKIDTLEKNAKVNTSSTGKQDSAAEKQVEEIKRQMGELQKKLDAAPEALKKKQEEWNAIERVLKKKIEELTAAAAQAPPKVA